MSCPAQYFCYQFQDSSEKSNTTLTMAHGSCACYRFYSLSEDKLGRTLGNSNSSLVKCELQRDDFSFSFSLVVLTIGLLITLCGVISAVSTLVRSKSERSEPRRKNNNLLTPLHSTPLHSTPLHSTPLHSTPLHSTPLHSTPQTTLKKKKALGWGPRDRVLIYMMLSAPSHLGNFAIYYLNLLDLDTNWTLHDGFRPTCFAFTTLFLTLSIMEVSKASEP